MFAFCQEETSHCPLTGMYKVCFEAQAIENDAIFHMLLILALSVMTEMCRIPVMKS